MVKKGVWIHKQSRKGTREKWREKENVQAEGILPWKFVSTDLVLIICVFLLAYDNA